MTRKELIDLAKELLAEENIEARRNDVALLKREAVRFLNRECETLAEEDENQELEGLYQEVVARTATMNASAYEDKKALIEKARALLNAKNFKQAANDMNEIFNQFKAAGRCSKEQDDELWAELKAIKDEFNKKRQEYFANLNATIENNKVAKENIIKEAKEVLEMTNFKEANNKLNALMEAWKKVGFAGKDVNDALWNEFQEIRKEFFKKRQEYFASLDTVYAERVAKKQALIKQARIVLANSEFTKEEADKLNQLRKEWKEIGFAGKENEDALWNEFNGIINKYYEEKRSY